MKFPKRKARRAAEPQVPPAKQSRTPASFWGLSRRRGEPSLTQAKRENAVELGKLPQMSDEFERFPAQLDCPADPEGRGRHHFQEWPGGRFTCSQCRGDLTDELRRILG